MKNPKKKKQIKQLRENLAITSQTMKMRDTKSFDDSIKLYEKKARESKIDSIKKAYSGLSEDTKKIKDQFQRKLVNIDSQFDTPSVHKQDKKRLKTLSRSRLK